MLSSHFVCLNFQEFAQRIDKNYDINNANALCNAGLF